VAKVAVLEEKTSPSISTFTINLTRNGLGLNLGLPVKKLSTNSLVYAMASFLFFLLFLVHLLLLLSFPFLIPHTVKCCCPLSEKYQDYWHSYFPKPYLLDLGIAMDRISDDTSVGFLSNPEGKRGKAIPVQSCRGPEGSRRLRLPEFETVGI
jgi:hypothetical protein